MPGCCSSKRCAVATSGGNALLWFQEMPRSDTWFTRSAPQERKQGHFHRSSLSGMLPRSLPSQPLPESRAIDCCVDRGLNQSDLLPGPDVDILLPHQGRGKDGVFRREAQTPCVRAKDPGTTSLWCQTLAPRNLCARGWLHPCWLC